MQSPITALIWDIWLRNRRLAWLLIGILSFAWIFNLVLHNKGRAAGTDPDWLMAMNFSLYGISLLLVLGMFDCTEFNPDKGSIGFPHRFFVLPVKSLVLVAVPMSLGVSIVELLDLGWIKFTFVGGDAAVLRDSAIMIGAYMVFYQTILWCLPGLRTMRIVALGLLAVVLMILSALPSFPNSILTERILIECVVGVAVIAFLIAWMDVARQRRGGGQCLRWPKAVFERIGAKMPKHTRPFGSSEAAQFWFEWRSSGLLLPLCIGTLLLAVIAPLSWQMRNDAESTLRILIATLAMPMILSLPVGKGLSKPDFWSSDLSLPAFIAVRPLGTEEMVTIKMKVAALSAATSWFLVLSFLCVWLRFWANFDSLRPLRRAISQFYGDSQYAQWSIVALSMLAGIFITWRFLVGGLWIGLSGNRKLFAATAIPYGLAPLGLIIPLVLIRSESPLRIWMRQNPEWLLSSLLWITALAVLARVVLAVFFWSGISRQFIRQLLWIWLAGTLSLIAMAVLIWTAIRVLLPVDASQLRNLLILVALLVMPLVRLGMAPSFLARNRHR